MGRLWSIAAVWAGLCVLAGQAMAEAAAVGAMAEVRQTVYGVPPQETERVKREGDPVVFQETIETRPASAARIRFIDDSTLTLGEKSKVLIDAFVFDPQKTEGNALIDISAGTLRFVTGAMPKGKTVIKTPTATLVLRGTDVTVHVHPDGTTDTVVHEGSVEAHNDVTNGTTTLAPGQGATLDESGNSAFKDPDDGLADPALGGAPGDTPEHRRGSQSNHAPDNSGSSPSNNNNRGGSGSTI